MLTVHMCVCVCLCKCVNVYECVYLDMSLYACVCEGLACVCRLADSLGDAFWVLSLHTFRRSRSSQQEWGERRWALRVAYVCQRVFGRVHVCVLMFINA